MLQVGDFSGILRAISLFTMLNSVSEIRSQL